jgi:hypothetical protein
MIGKIFSVWIEMFPFSFTAAILCLFQVESLEFRTINRKSLWRAGISKVIPIRTKCQVGRQGKYLTSFGVGRINLNMSFLGVYAVSLKNITRYKNSIPIFFTGIAFNPTGYECEYPAIACHFRKF